MNSVMVLMQTIADELPALRVIVYPVITFKEKVRLNGTVKYLFSNSSQLCVTVSIMRFSLISVSFHKSNY
jgi:hypothetical protein